MKQLYVKGEKIAIRMIEGEDLYPLWQEIYKEEKPEWKKWDAPYFPFVRQEFPIFQERIRSKLEKDPYSQLIIEKEGEIIGIVTYYWEHEPSRWLEIGITIYNPAYWSGGYGTDALRLYVDVLFQHLRIARVGLTTWSGNRRMMKVAEKLGMQLEGRMRKCRYYNGEYYDSIRMGMIREEWEEMKAARG
ncbi:MULTISPECIES: GNAT family N-acetyltransferase [Bacillus]|uniref:GNAT family N-acetyltransferase n=1 Tax=Bacillus TaxID=1386 RepID=UPI00209FC31C|nr:GNAT family protein [Bacillus sp. 3103sda1]MCP1123541.1 GNAT family N-acetyltransferase [Bacillus sp. 3103sda1]